MPSIIPRGDGDRAERRADRPVRLGPYETAYNVQRGYDRPPPEPSVPGDVILFRGREQRRR